MEDMKTLTKAEEQIMQILWNLKEGVVKDVVEQFEEPRPAYTTVATVLKVLENKGFVTCRKIGNINLFFPGVTKHEYARFQFSSLLKDYFSGSFPKLATFFAKENNLGIKDLEEILKAAEKELIITENKE
jgi:BlaI family transcriptional regulator, penicillinase repressor